MPTVFEVVTGNAKKQTKEKSSVSNHSSNKSKSNSKVQLMCKWNFFLIGFVLIYDFMGYVYLFMVFVYISTARAVRVLIVHNE